ncbi:SMP-30/gluconolactonase/LRE family protein [Ulvibacterium marinum]|uniref:SMP-30/gluconolactonase/LRE family protein n=1 Tax=Ulvibacterium marinum TaxID=2419782 RepID=A0A3B0CHF8_9FLAO|nr:SMP-30/gluconolactonase/LRE family protein [Ulvibacterium marinum]RKN82826.1 SMP-30/gluconolactonase/LRE family protein [Ulvibacterium marinum]
MRISKADLLLDTKSILGEGPVWDWRKQHLLWVDIEGNGLHLFNPRNQQHRQWTFDGMLGAVVPIENGTMLLALESGLATFDLTNEQLIRLPVLKNSNPGMRYNDGKVDPNGNFWIGSMHKKAAPEMGNLYRVDTQMNVSTHIVDTSISNGMAWTSDKKKFYYIDSTAYEVWRYDYDVATSEIRTKHIAFSIPKDFGAPDGMSIDEENMLWIAHWGGNCIRRWNPNTGEVLETVEVDAPHVTSCCFGGNDLKTLYITTARSGLSQSQLETFPLSGGLFVYESQVKGTPISYFKDST